MVERRCSRDPTAGVLVDVRVDLALVEREFVCSDWLKTAGYLPPTSTTQGHTTLVGSARGRCASRLPPASASSPAAVRTRFPPPMLLRRWAPPCAPRAPPGSSSPARSSLPLRRGCFLRPAAGNNASYQVKNIRLRPAFALETGGSPTSDGQDVEEEDSGFLGRTRLGRLIQAAASQLLAKLNSGRVNSPSKIFLVLLGFYTANALATILGQTGDWDVLVAGVVVAAIEVIGKLLYRKPVAARPPGRFQSLIAMLNYWKAGVSLGLFVDAFKVGS